MNTKEISVKAYFDSWVQRDNAIWDTILAPNIYYSESYGPYYHGLEQLKRWFAHWMKHGNVSAWNILTCFETLDTLVVEWEFAYVYDGCENRFAGISIMKFNEEGKICSVKEFQSTLPHKEVIF